MLAIRALTRHMSEDTTTHQMTMVLQILGTVRILALQQLVLRKALLIWPVASVLSRRHPLCAAMQL